MVRTLASFKWDVPFAADEQQPFAKADVANLVAGFRAGGIDVTQPEDAEYAWDFFARLPHIGMDCHLGPVGNDQHWLRECYPVRGLVNWLLRRWWVEEQEGFVNRLDETLRADKRISDVRWHTREEWDRNGV
ncbi:MAG: hypothetical protein HYX68_10725 [Planctomycetes bacterium]|jgi:hypothetical protein|nr:hypothetical protein [Planctomycetota bacterium]